MTLIVEVPAHLSHSQADNLVGDYCPASQFFGRVLGKPERPGWAQLGGSALHEASEDWDHALLEGEVDVDPGHLAGLFNRAMDKQIARVLETTPYPREEWHRSGREAKVFSSTGGPNKKDEAWWRHTGPSMLAAWTTWRLYSPWEIAVLSRNEETGVEVHGIETQFSTMIGGELVVGYIDRVMQRWNEATKAYDYLVVDLKSGMEPKSTAQLGTYREGLWQSHNVDAVWGCYWLGSTGLSTPLTDLRAKWPLARLERRFSAARRRQLAGEFDPKPSNLCGSCGVKDYCAEYGGHKAAETPQPWDITEVRIAAPRDSFGAVSDNGSAATNDNDKDAE